MQILNLKNWPVVWRTLLMVLTLILLTMIGFLIVIRGLTSLTDLLTQQQREVASQQQVLAEQQSSLLLQNTELEAQRQSLAVQQDALVLQQAVFEVYKAYPEFLFWRLASTTSLSDNDIRNGDDAQQRLLEAVAKIQDADEELADSIELFMLDMEDFNANIAKAIEDFSFLDDRAGKAAVSVSQNNVMSMTAMLDVVLYVTDELMGEAQMQVNDRLGSLTESIKATELNSQHVAREAGKIADSIDQGVATAGNIQRSTLVLVGIIAVLSILVGLVLSRSISEPIRRLQQRITKIERDADLSLRVAEDRSDEVGSIAVSLNAMLVRFSRIINDVRSSVAEVSREAHQQTEEIADTRQALGNVDSEARAVESAIQQLTTMAADINHITSQAAAEAVSGQELCRGSSRQVSSSSEELQSLNQRLSEASTQLKTLVAQTDQIYAVVDVIQSVSEQTNLLALNAAIEAARAGDQGRGFAVVADEVRTLAQRTDQSSAEIKDMVEQFARDVGTTANAVDAAMSAAETSNSNMQQARDGIDALMTNIQTLRGMSEQISAATQDQTEASSAVSDSVSRIGQLLSAVEDSIGTMNRSAERLDQQTQSLEQQAQQFRT